MKREELRSKNARERRKGERAQRRKSSKYESLEKGGKVTGKNPRKRRDRKVGVKKERQEVEKLGKRKRGKVGGEHAIEKRKGKKT